MLRECRLLAYIQYYIISRAVVGKVLNYVTRV